MSESVDSLKQRLVGAFVILSLAIIFLPMIFDKPHQENRSVLVPVPPKPEFKTIEIGKPVQPKFKVLEVDKETNKIFEGNEYIEADGQSTRLSRKNAAHLAGETELKVNDAQAEKNTGVSSTVQESNRVMEAASKTSSDKAPVAVNERPKVAKPKVSHLPVFKNTWMVQLGTFSKASNAYALRDKLRADGFDGHTKEVTLGGKRAIKVFTGPFVKKHEALRIKKKLDQKYKVDSRLIFFDA